MRQNSIFNKINTSGAMLRGITPLAVTGRIASASGLVAEISGLTGQVFVGDQLMLHGRDGAAVRAEVAGFRDGLARALPFGTLDGLGPGQVATVLPRGAATLAVSNTWLGRVIDPLGRAIDGKGPVPPGATPRPIMAAPPEATTRARLGGRVTLGVRALDLFTTCRLGQRLGLFAGSGVGKSTLLAMLARFPDTVLHREQLLDLVWGATFYSHRSVDVHVARLRDKLKGSGVRIETAWGSGYRLTASAA